ncbi:MAG: PQQ-binding-like beta-propeller repeat protein [Zavarzinella sp.]
MMKQTLIFSMLLAGVGSLIGAEHDWPTYRGNAQRTGTVDTVAGPKKPAVQWFLKSEENFIASPVPSGQELLLSSIGAFNKPTLLALSQAPADRAMIAPRWMKSAPMLKLPSVSAPAVVGDSIYFGDGMHQTDGAILYCFPSAGGHLTWAYAVPGELVHMEGAPTVHNNRIYLGAGSAGVICLDATTLDLNGKAVLPKDVPALQEQRWKELLAKYEKEKKEDPDFAVPPTEDQLHRPQPKLVWQAGAKKWHVDAPVLLVGDRLYVASAFLDKEKLGERALFCLDAATGKELWKTPLTYNPWGGASFDQDTLIITTSSISYDPKSLQGSRGEILAIDPASGKVRWQKSIAGGILGCAALRDGSAYFTCTDGRVRGMSLKDGSRTLLYDAKASLFAPPVVTADTVFAADNAGVVHAIVRKTGQPAWTLSLKDAPIQAPGMNYGGLTLHGGKLFLATCNLEGEFARQPTCIVCIGGE